VQALRAAYRTKRAESAEEALIFIDESGASLDLTRPFGWAPRGERAYGEKPTGSGGRISTIGALSLRGLETALCFEGTLNGAVFLFFLEHFLCPRLQPGHWVVMDNARAHQVIGVRDLIERTGARVLYLPPYSPEYNPIELVWSVAKQRLRTLQARTKDALYDAWVIALEAVSPLQAKHCFQHTRKVST
jgi:transposase